MVHMVKGPQYSALQSQKWSLRPTLNLDVDNHRRRTRQRHTARTREVWPAVLVKESSTRPAYNVFSGYMRQILTYIWILKSQKDSIEALSFLVIIS